MRINPLATWRQPPNKVSELTCCVAMYCGRAVEQIVIMKDMVSTQTNTIYRCIHRIHDNISCHRNRYIYIYISLVVHVHAYGLISVRRITVFFAPPILTSCASCFLWHVMGWGGVGIITNVPFAPLLDLSVICHATLRDLVLCLMLRYLNFL